MTRRKQTEAPRGPEAIEDRRVRVASLLALHPGLSIRQIARSFGITKNQAEGDMKAVRPRFRKVLEHRAEDIYVGGAALIDEMQREIALTLGSIPREPKYAGVRLQAIQLLLSIPERRARLGQSLGLVVQAPERIEIVQGIQRDLADALMRMPEGDRVAAEILKSRTR